MTIGGKTYYYGMTNSASYIQVTNTSPGNLSDGQLCGGNRADRQHANRDGPGC